MPSNPRVKYHRVNDTDGYVDAQVKNLCLPVWVSVLFDEIHRRHPDPVSA